MPHANPFLPFTAEQHAEANRLLGVSRGTKGFEQVGLVEVSSLKLDAARGHELVMPRQVIESKRVRQQQRRPTMFFALSLLAWSGAAAALFLVLVSSARADDIDLTAAREAQRTQLSDPSDEFAQTAARLADAQRLARFNLVENGDAIDLPHGRFAARLTLTVLIGVASLSTFVGTHRLMAYEAANMEEIAAYQVFQGQCRRGEVLCIRR